MNSQSFRFLKQQHLRKSEDFRRVYDAAQRAGDEHLLIMALVNNLPWTRIGLSVSRKHGNAVRRNRRKRLLREAFRLTQHQLAAGLDLILIPRQREDSTLSDLQNSLRKLVGKLARRLQPAEPATHQEAPDGGDSGVS